MTDQGPRPSQGPLSTEKDEPIARPASATPYSSGPFGGGPRPDRRKRWIWIGLGVLVAAVLIWIMAPHGAAPTQGGGGPGGAGGGRRSGGAGGAPTSVGAFKSVRGDVPIYIFGLGTATPTQTVTVRTQISGQLLEVYFKEGQIVSKGQVLAQVDPRPYQANLQQAEGTLARDKALLDNANIDLKRYSTLLSQDSIASQQVDTQKALVHQYEGTVKSDQAAVATQKLNLIYCRITSPVSGRVGLRQVDPGNYVTAGDTNGLAVVTAVDPMDVLFTVPEDNLAQVAARLHTGASLETIAFDRTQTIQLAVGKLLTLDNQVDTTTGTVRAKARFDNHSSALFPNQFVNVRLLVDSLKGTVIVPTAAILKGSQGLFVYVVGDDHTVEVRPVKTGPAAGENTAITSGLDPDEVVVTDGSDRLRDGQRVILPGDCLGAGGMGGGGGHSGRHASGTGAAGAAGAAKPEGPGLSNLFGLIKTKPAADPMAAMRCKPGQKPASGLDSVPPTNLAGSGMTTSAAGAPAAATTTTTTTSTVSSHSTPQAAVTAPPPSASAPIVQGPPSPPAPGGSAKDQARAARMKALYAPLGLTPDQQAKIGVIMAAQRPKMMAAFQSGDMASAKAARDDMNKQIDALLTPDQRTKMQAIRAQMQAQRGGGGGG